MFDTPVGLKWIQTPHSRRGCKLFVNNGRTWPHACDARAAHTPVRGTTWPRASAKRPPRLSATRTRGARRPRRAYTHAGVRRAPDPLSPTRRRRMHQKRPAAVNRPATPPLAPFPWYALQTKIVRSPYVGADADIDTGRPRHTKCYGRRGGLGLLRRERRSNPKDSGFEPRPRSDGSTGSGRETCNVRLQLRLCMSRAPG